MGIDFSVSIIVRRERASSPLPCGLLACLRARAPCRLVDAPLHCATDAAIALTGLVGAGLRSDCREHDARPPLSEECSTRVDVCSARCDCVRRLIVRGVPVREASRPGVRLRTLYLSARDARLERAVGRESVCLEHASTACV